MALIDGVVGPGVNRADQRFATGMRWWIYAATALLPVAYLSRVEDAYVLPKLVLLRAAVAGLLAGWLLRGAILHTLRVRRSIADIPVVMFVLSSLLSTIAAENSTLAVVGAYTRYESLTTHITYALLFWLIVQTIESAEHVRCLVRALLVGGFLAGAYAVIQSVQITLSPAGPGADNAFAFNGIARAYGTMGNPTLLGTLMAMLLPLVLFELTRARSTAVRITCIDALIVMTIALVLTFSRSSWLGAGVGVSLTGLLSRGSLAARVRRWGVAALSVGAALVVLAVWVRAMPTHGLVQSLGDRVRALADVNGSGGTRLHLWRDTLSAIIHRPLIGYGPDNFGLVYPLYQSGDWTPGFAPDKAHSDLLDIAVAQGLIGVAATMAVAVALVRAARRTLDGAGGVLLCGCAAYEVVTMLNFAWLPVTAIVWIMAAGVVAPSATLHVIRLRGPSQAVTAGLLIPALALAASAGVFGVVRPILADRHYFLALDSAGSDPVTAWSEISQAEALAPHQGEYATGAGDIAFDAADWPSSSAAYGQATLDGSGDAGTFAGLAQSDCHLGRSGPARQAWARAATLQPFGIRGRAAPC